MLWSKMFIPTLRAAPSAEPPSIQLLQRAGYLRAPDRWLPLAQRSMRRMAALIRREFDGVGAQEMLLPNAAGFPALARELRSYKQLPQVWYSFGPHLEARSFGFEGLGLEEIFGRILQR